MRRVYWVFFLMPLIILWLVSGAIKASTFPAIVKGAIIGLYFGISLIGLYELGRGYFESRLTDKDKFY